MPEYLSPGVYIQEVDSGPRPIEGVGTATAAFVGFAANGPINRPTLVTNWTQFAEAFGAIEDGGRRNPYMEGAYLPHAVYGFFLNGGGRCYITRVTPPSSNGSASGTARSSVQLPSRASRAVPSLTVSSKGDQSADIEIEVTPAAPPAPPAPPAAGAAPAGGDGAASPDGSLFNLRVRMADQAEEYPNVTLGKQRNVRNVVETVNQASTLVTLAEGQATGPLADRAPEAGTYVLRSEAAALVPAVEPKDFVGQITERSGVEGLEIADDVTMVCCPDVMAAYQAGSIDRDGVKAVQLAMINHCERMGDRVAIIDPLPDLSPQEVRQWRQVETNFDSKFAAVYYPWIKISGPDGRPMAVPPSGYMAGVYARSDNERGVHKAPANEVLRGALEAASAITKGEQDVLNPIGINCLRSFTGRGLRVWGARTLSSDPAWRYINVRRLFNYVEKSIQDGLQWVVFEPNDVSLWARVRRDVNAFLTGVWREGALFGATTDQAFFVKCDEELNPPDVRDRGQLFIDIGLAPVKPAEFVIFRLSQWAGGGS
jgi:phage tail sheath protein FI